jgi:hypothetical protein
MTEREYRQDDELGRGFCPHCHRAMSLDTGLYGWCAEHGRVPADFHRPQGWVENDALPDGYYPFEDEERKRDDLDAAYRTQEALDDPDDNDR